MPYIGFYLTSASPSAAAAQTSSGVQSYLATVPADALNDAHSTWVPYDSVDADARHWRHATTYVLLANTLVRVTIYTFDSQSGLRNPFIARATGKRSPASLKNLHRPPLPASTHSGFIRVR